MPRMKSQIMSHNWKILEEKTLEVKLCKYKGKYEVGGKCLLTKYSKSNGEHKTICLASGWILKSDIRSTNVTLIITNTVLKRLNQSTFLN